MFCQAIFRNSLRNVGPINNVRRWIEFLCELCMSVDMKKSTKTALKWTKWYLTKNRSRPISWSADHARRCSTWKLPPASKDDGKIHENCREWHWKNSRASLYNPVVYPYHSWRFSSLELFSPQSSPKSHRTHYQTMTCAFAAYKLLQSWVTKSDLCHHLATFTWRRSLDKILTF